MSQRNSNAGSLSRPIVKYTPSPWEFCEANGKTYVHDEEGQTVAVAGGGYPLSEEIANAHLISAAPDLLDACEVALREIGACTDGCNEMLGVRLRAAIAKAKGIALLIALSCTSLLLISLPARADFPIVEVGWAQPSAIELPAVYVFEMKGWYWGGFLNQYPPGQHPGYVTSYPVVQWADQTSIDQWNADPAHSIYSVAIAQGGQQPNGQFGGQFLIDYAVGGQNKLWADGWSDGAPTAKFGTYIGTAFATQKGLGGLEGYKITRVERTITALSQVVKIYGEDFEYTPIVPEPGALVLLTIPAVVYFVIRSRQRQRQR